MVWIYLRFPQPVSIANCRLWHLTTVLLNSNCLACQEITHNIASRDVVDLYTASLLAIIYMEQSTTIPHDAIIMLEIFYLFQLLEQFGKVATVRANGDLRVKYEGRTWTINPSCVTKVCVSCT